MNSVLNCGGAWNQDLDTVRLPIGSSKVKAQTWLPAPMESAEVERVISAIKSDEVLVLELKGRRVLTARLALPNGLVLPRTVEYKIRRLVGAEEVDPKSLARAKSQHRASSPTAGRAAWYDLEPGRYLVAAFLNRRRLIGHATAEVTDGATEVELPASELDAGTHVTVRLLGPDGGPVPGQSSFRVIPEGGRSQRVDALQADDGSWLVFTDGVAAKGANDATLRVGTRDFGGQTHPVSLGSGGTITMRFGKPARLAVKIEGYGGSGVEGSLFVALRSKLGADAWRAVSPDGSCELNGVQPGDYNLNLFVRKNNRNWSIYQRRIDLRPGEDEITLPMPTLHTLRVRWAGKGRPRNVVLRCKDESVGPSRRDARLNARVATFTLVAAGTYEIECARKRATTRVPGPEVTIQ